MNRQLRRAQEKSDKKQDKEKAKRRQDRRDRVQRLRAARGNRTKAKTDKSRETSGGTEKSGKAGAGQGTGNAAKGGRGREPGRFAGAFALATVFFITLQGAYPDPDRTYVNSLISAGFYLMLGYFGVLWMLRRGTERAFVFTVAGGVLLAISTSVAVLIQGRALDPLLLALVLPAVIAGSYLGRLVYIHTPR